MFDEHHVLRTTIVLTVVLSLGTVWIRFPIAAGFVLGGIMSALCFRLLILNCTSLLKSCKIGSISPDDAPRYARKGYYRRYLLYAGALSISILSPYTNFFSTLVGLLMPRIAIYYLMIKGRIKRGT